MEQARKEATITVFTGPMFSRKSGELMLRIERAQRANKRVLVVKPKKDLRVVGKIVSRRMKREEKKFEEFISQPAYTVSTKEEVLELINKGEYDILAADEVQFFEEWFVDLVTHLAWERGIEVVLAGLDLDAWRRPFGIMPHILAVANKVEKLTADCFNPKCGKEARFTQKKGGSGKQIEIGDNELYEARCGNCWMPPHIR